MLKTSEAEAQLLLIYVQSAREKKLFEYFEKEAIEIYVNQLSAWMVLIWLINGVICILCQTQCVCIF